MLMARVPGLESLVESGHVWTILVANEQLLGFCWRLPFVSTLRVTVCNLSPIPPAIMSPDTSSLKGWLERSPFGPMKSPDFCCFDLWVPSFSLSKKEGAAVCRRPKVRPGSSVKAGNENFVVFDRNDKALRGFFFVCREESAIVPHIGQDNGRPQWYFPTKREVAKHGVVCVCVCN